MFFSGQIFVKNADGEIVKGMPIRVTRAHSIKVTSYPNPESKQLILENVYEIKIEIFDKNEQAIYPSEVIIFSKFLKKTLGWVR